MDVVRVDLGARSYEVRIGDGPIANAVAEIAPLLARPRVAVISDETVASLHLEALRTALVAGGDRDDLAGIAAGRGHKVLGAAAAMY